MSDNWFDVAKFVTSICKNCGHPLIQIYEPLSSYKWKHFDGNLKSIYASNNCRNAGNDCDCIKPEPVKVYKIIGSFFIGEQHFDESEIGKVWVARHGSKAIGLCNWRDIVAKKDMGSGIIPPQVLRSDSLNKDIIYIPEFETLTIEPKDGGQYEVAVRIWSIEDNEWQGYYVFDFARDIHSKYLSGMNTEGH